MFRNHAFVAAMAFLCTVFSAAPMRQAVAVSPNFVPPPVPQITQAINPAVRHVFAGNTNRRIVSGQGLGALGDNETLGNLLLSLKRSPQREVAFEQFIDEQHDPSSPYFHQWLTPTQVGELYGPAQSDIDTVVAWLQDNGFTVNEVAPSGMTIDFTGTAGQVKSTFQAPMGRYSVNGATYISNTVDPSVPAALAPVVAGIVSLNNSFKTTNYTLPPQPPLLAAGDWSINKDKGQYPTLGKTANFAPYNPNFTFVYNSSTYEAVAPGDFNIIYDVNPVWTAGNHGEGQTIWALERTRVKAADVTTFRTAFGLSGYTGTFTQTTPSGCTNPGQLATGDQGEAALDVEWAGAVAPNANVVLYACKSTLTTDGIDLSVQKAVNDAAAAKIFTLSYGSCESSMGSTENASYNTWWQQAASEGITVFVSAGDQGAAVCDSDSSSNPPYGWATSGIAGCH